MNLQNCTSNENGKLMRIADFVTFFKGLKPSPDDVDRRGDHRAADAVQRDAPARARADDRHGRDGAAHRAVVHVQQRRGGALGAHPAVHAGVRRQRHVREHLRRRLQPGDGAHRRQDRGPHPPPVPGAAAGRPGPCAPRGASELRGLSRDQDQRRPGSHQHQFVRRCDATMLANPIRQHLPGTGTEVIVDRGSVPAPPRTVITVLCETCQTAEDPRCSGG